MASRRCWISLKNLHIFYNCVDFEDHSQTRSVIHYFSSNNAWIFLFLSNKWTYSIAGMRSYLSGRSDSQQAGPPLVTASGSHLFRMLLNILQICVSVCNGCLRALFECSKLMYQVKYLLTKMIIIAIKFLKSRPVGIRQNVRPMAS